MVKSKNLEVGDILVTIGPAWVDLEGSQKVIVVEIDTASDYFKVWWPFGPHSGRSWWFKGSRSRMWFKKI